MKTFVKVSQQTFWQLAGKAITSLSTFFILGMVARAYGEAGTGIFTLTLTYLAFFYLVADFGFNTHIIQNLTTDNLSLNWRKLFGLRLLLTFVLIIVAVFIVLIWPVNEFFRQSVQIAAGAILGVSLFTSAALVFQYKLRYDLYVLATSIGAIVTLPIFYLVTQNNLPIPDLMLGHMLGWLLIGGFGLLFIKKYLRSLFPVFDWFYIKKTLSEVWPISLTFILNVVYFRVDAFILSGFRSFTEVGIYNLSYQIFQSLLVVPAFIMNSFYPLMLKDFSQNKDKFKNNLIKASLLMFVVALGGTLLTLIFSPQVISLISGGKGFNGSVAALQILSLGFPAFFVSSVFMLVLVVLKKYKTMLLIYLIGLLVNFVLNIVLIPQYSYLAASWVTVVSEYLILVLQIVILMKLSIFKKLIFP